MAEFIMFPAFFAYKIPTCFCCFYVNKRSEIILYSSSERTGILSLNLIYEIFSQPFQIFFRKLILFPFIPNLHGKLQQIL